MTPRQVLERRRATLRKSLGLPPLAIDTGDLADEANSRSLVADAFATQERWTNELREVEAALERMERGTYGRCAWCAQPIALARLAATPEAALCITCKRLEDDQQARSQEPMRSVSADEDDQA